MSLVVGAILLTVLVDMVRSNSVRPDFTLTGHSKSRIPSASQARPSYRPYKKAMMKAKKHYQCDSYYVVDETGRWIPLRGLKKWWAELRAVFRHIALSAFWYKNPAMHFLAIEPDSTARWKRTSEVRDASQFAVGSTTGGIQEAINDLSPTGGTVYIPTGIYTVATKITVPNTVHGLIIQGGGSFNQETNMQRVGGTKINSYCTDGLLDFATIPGIQHCCYLRDVDIVQKADQTSKNTCLVDFTYVFTGGIDNVTIFADLAVGLCYKGYALWFNPIDSNDDKRHIRNLSVGGMGGAEADPSNGQIALGGNHLQVDMVHINGNQCVTNGIYFPVVGARWSLKNIHFFQLGKPENIANFVCLTTALPMPVGNHNTILEIDGVYIEDYHPRQAPNLQVDDYFSMGTTNGNLTLIIRRAINGNPEGAFNPFLTSILCPKNLIVKSWGGGALGVIQRGFATNFLYTRNVGGTDYYRINPTLGTTAVPVASKDYAVEVTEFELYIQGGAGVTITVNGVVIPYDVALGTPLTLHLKPGDVINFGAFGGAPTVRAYCMVDN